MLKDITLGQYFPGNSIIHRLDPRFKIIIAAAFIGMLFAVGNIYDLLLGGGFIVFAFLLSKIRIKLLLKSLKPLAPLLIFTAIFDLLFIDGGEIRFKWFFIQITEEGISVTIYMILRIIFLIIASSLLTYTTSPMVLTDAIEHLLSPLKKFKLPIHEFTLMMTIALRFIPTLLEETDRIMSAQKARGADFENGSLMKRAKALIPVLVPLFVSAFTRAEELALAMTCRCYNGGAGRTRLKQLKSSSADYVALAVSFIFFALILFIKA